MGENNEFGKDGWKRERNREDKEWFEYSETVLGERETVKEEGGGEANKPRAGCEVKWRSRAATLLRWLTLGSIFM